MISAVTRSRADPSGRIKASARSSASSGNSGDSGSSAATGSNPRPGRPLTPNGSSTIVCCNSGSRRRAQKRPSRRSYPPRPSTSCSVPGCSAATGAGRCRSRRADGHQMPVARVLDNRSGGRRVALGAVGAIAEVDSAIGPHTASGPGQAACFELVRAGRGPDDPPAPICAAASQGLAKSPSRANSTTPPACAAPPAAYRHAPPS